MSPGAPTRDDTPGGDGAEARGGLQSAIPIRRGNQMRCSTSLQGTIVGDGLGGRGLWRGATCRGIAGWRLTAMDREPIGTGRLPPLGGRRAPIFSRIGDDPPTP